MFKPAVKREAKLRLAIAGPSGSGKTYTALTLATALGKTAVIDTEHGSASKYADRFQFDVLNLAAPFHPKRFAEAIKAAEAAGYEVVVIDSLSHAWNGPGGVLEIVDAASKRFKGNTYAGWQEGTPAHNSLIEAVVGSSLHVIGTMRSKQDYILVERNGRQTPQKVGMAPVQRDGMEYEFDVYLEMDMENNGIVQKTRCSALTGQVIAKPGKALADTLKEWLSGEPALEQPAGDSGDNGDSGGNNDNNDNNTSFDDLEPALFPVGTPVLVAGKNDEKPGTVTDVGKGDLRAVKVDGREITVSTSRLKPLPGQPKQPALISDEPAGNGAYAES